MVKATAPLSPRQVLGNHRTTQRLSTEEASAALVAMLSGAHVIPPRTELRKIAASVRQRQEAGASRAHVAALQERLATLQIKEVCNV